MELLTADPDPGNVGRRAEGEDLGQSVVGVGGVTEDDVEGASGLRTQPGRVELLTYAEVTNLISQSQRPSTGSGGQVQQMNRGQWVTGRAQQLLSEVRLQALFEQAESGTGPDI